MPRSETSPIDRIFGVAPRPETFAQLDIRAGGVNLSWADDDVQLVSVSDGSERADPPTKSFHAYIYRLIGPPPSPEVEELPHYPHMAMRLIESEYASFWGGSCLAIDEKIYQFLMTPNHPYLTPQIEFWPDFRAAGSKLICSPDRGATWCNQDGSRPVMWENWDQRSRTNMAFFDETPQGAFVWPTFLQMGKGYRANRDGFVYVYATNGDIDGAANQLVMLRTPKDRVADRNAYEFYAGCNGGEPLWTHDITKRSVVHTFPSGWVSSTCSDGEMRAGWAINVVYNEPLQVYLLVAQGNGPSDQGVWFGKASYLGVWVGATPWGPFKQIHEDRAWTPNNDANGRCFSPSIAPMWISGDGRSFWLCWSDYGFQGDRGETENPDKSFLEIAKGVADDAEFARVITEWSSAHMTGGGFNIQRFDLLLD